MDWLVGGQLLVGRIVVGGSVDGGLLVCRFKKTLKIYNFHNREKLSFYWQHAAYEFYSPDHNILLY